MVAVIPAQCQRVRSRSKCLISAVLKIELQLLRYIYRAARFIDCLIHLWMR